MKWVTGRPGYVNSRRAHRRPAGARARRAPSGTRSRRGLPACGRRLRRRGRAGRRRRCVVPGRCLQRGRRRPVRLAVGRRRRRQGTQAVGGRDRAATRGTGSDRLPRAADGCGRDRTARREGRVRVRDGVDPAHHARAADGCAFLAGDGVGLQGGVARRRPAPALPADADDRRGHRCAGEGARPRRRGRRPAGDRDGAPARRRRGRLRRAPGRAGTGREPRRDVPRPRDHGRGDGGRLRARADGRRAAPAAGGARGAHSRVRRRDHDGTRPWPRRAPPDPGGRGRRHAPRLGDRRPRCRSGRQLRADAARRGRRAGGRHDRRPDERPVDDAVSREPAVRAQRLRPAPASRAERRARARLGRRDHRRGVRDKGEGDGVSHGLLLTFEITILVLAIFLGFEVISKVPTLLHTPLMSGTNAIHGIVIVGAMLVAGLGHKDTLATIIAFILALRFLSHPTTARRGNWIGAVGMLIAIVVTFVQNSVVSFWEIAVGMVIGGAFGAVAARRVRMTAMPQMVALFNGVGGGAAAMISLAEFHNSAPDPRRLHGDISVSIILSALIGSISFAGSMVAFAKLQELIQGRPIVYPGQQVVNGALLAAVLACGIAIVAGAEQQWLIVALILGALLFGVLFVLPIGGADMPVVIALLNAFTGLAAAATGFVLHNNVLIVSGMLVGASGTLLTMLMGRAMNRSLANVLFGAFGQIVAGPAAAAGDGAVRSTTPEDVAVMLAFAKKVVVVPGYGLAVAQAQHDVRQLADLLEQRGVDVTYAIHPVAGRMPGHMNVLLAEANVPYDQLKEMEEINPEFDETDVALVIGANDVTNPAARNELGSPIYGMPILNVDHAKAVVVLKRSMNPGFAGI